VKRWLLAAAAAVVVAVVGAGIAFYLVRSHEARDVNGSSTVEFVPTETTPPKQPKEPGVAWAQYGFDMERLRVATGSSLAPPFKRAWTFHARELVEFPPAVAYGRLFFANGDGVLFAVGAKNGRKAWSWDSHRCQAASPAVDRHTVFATFMNAPPCNRSPDPRLTGKVVALAVGTGKIRWQRTIGPSESSPAIVGTALIVGDWDGRVWKLDERTGRVLWSRKLGGQVKGGVAVSGSRVFVGDYSGHVTCLGLATGKVIWTAKAQPRFGGTGTFYATPAVAYGRVYIGATDGKMYSFGATSGKLRWSQSTGGYVYSSAAVWHDLVLAGSYSKRFFAFDAATGRIVWSFAADGPISGSPTIVAGRVYFATLKGTTYALDARTGRRLWTFPDGKYSPVVADADRLYLVGYATVYGLERPRAKRLAHRLGETAALRALRRAGFRRLKVVGTRPLALRVGEIHGRAAHVHVCHLALRGGPKTVQHAAQVLRKACD
jgi:outer membrane protein assembly factor BamB